jgi:hypothetical protein
MLGDAYQGALHGRAGLEEVIHQPQPERLDTLREVNLRQRVDGVAHGVRRQKAGVVAPNVRPLEIAFQGDIHGQVPQLVTSHIAPDFDEPDLRLPVVVLAEVDLSAHPASRLGHCRSPSCSTRSWRRRRAIFAISPSAVSTSSSREFCRRLLAFCNMDSFVCSLTQTIIGNPNLSR